MKIRFTCSFFGCLHDHLHGFTEPDPLRPVHKVAYPVDMGLEPEITDWSLEYLIAQSPVALQRLARRAIETVGQAETLDFLVGLPDPLYPRRHALGQDIGHLVERLNTAFADHQPVDWLFVIPNGAWLERLSRYHLLKAGPADFPQATSAAPAAVIGELARLGFACVESTPDEIMPLLAGRFHGLASPELPATLEGFATLVRDGAMLVTSDPAIFAAWQDIHASAIAGQLPEEWETHLGKYWHVLGHVMRHLPFNMNANGQSGTP